MKVPLFSARFSFAALLAFLHIAPSSLAEAAAITPFVPSPDYVAQGLVAGAKTGPHRSTFTTRFDGNPAFISRPLSVHPDSSLNGEVSSAHSSRLGPRPLPLVFGGFTAVVYGMKSPTSFTARAQFQDSSERRNDLINLNVYVENNQPQPPGLEFSFIGAFLFPAGEAGAPAIVPLEKITHATFTISSQRILGRVARALVRDTDSGDFYVSEISATENKAHLPLTGSKWAKINPADLTLSGDYRPAPFQRVDHVGVYATIPVNELADVLPAFGVICNVALQSFEYGLLP